MSLTAKANLSSTITSTHHSYQPKYVRLGIISTLTALLVLLSGCSTTHEFKPTASVMVGATTSL